MGNLKDFGTSTVLTAPSPATSGTSIVVQTGHGARFPAAPFYVTVHPPSEFPTLDNAEKLEVTAKTDDTFTVLRAQGDTTAKSIEAGWRISNSLFLADIPVVNSTSVDSAGATMNTDTTLVGNGYFLDEDTMSSNSDTKVPSQQSVKAYVDAAITATKSALYPVGSIYTNATDATNPATLLGFGTWTAFAAGRVMVGKNSSGTFGTIGATGGAETHTLTEAEMPAHNHGGRVAGSSNGDYFNINDGGGQGGWGLAPGSNNNGRRFTIPTSGSGSAHNNLQPYIVVYMWQRTA